MTDAISTADCPGPQILTADDYHSDFSRDSNSSLKEFRESRERYEALRITKTIEPDEPTPAMLFGSMLHDFLLEPDFDDRFGSWEKQDKRTKEGKWAWEQAQKKHAGKTIITTEDLEVLRGMRDGVLRNPEARKIMEAAGVNEKPIYWTDPETGLALKCKPDRLLECGLIPDLKTLDTATEYDLSPSGFGRAAFNRSYHCQAALYQDGVASARGGEIYEFIFIVISKTAPYEVAVHVLDKDDLELGRMTNRATLKELAECRRSGNFTGRWSDKINTCFLPKWAHPRR